MGKGKQKVRVLMPHILASVGGPAHVEGDTELDADVAEAAAELGAVEFVGRKAPRAAQDKPAAAKTTSVRRGRPRKTTTTLTKSDVPGAG